MPGKALMVGAILCAIQTPAFGQLEIKDNGVKESRIDAPKQVDSWTVELPEKVKTLHIEVACGTTKVVVFLKKGKEEFVLFPDGAGDRSHAIGVAGNKLVAYPQPDRHLALDKGRYTITVEAADRKGTGDYTIRIPELPAVKGPKPAPETNKEKIDRLEKELEAVRRKQAELVAELKKLKADDPNENK